MTESKMNSTTERLQRLTEAVGVTGYQGPHDIRDVVAAELEPFADEVYKDRVGSVVGLKRGQVAEGAPRRKLMIAAHLDEIGGVVTSVERGFLRFTQIGGLDRRVLMGQEMIVHGREALLGIVGSVPPHLLSPGGATEVQFEHLHIDVGRPAAEVEALVQVGDRISFAPKVTTMIGGTISSKSLDNRGSIAAMIHCLQQLQGQRHQWDVYAVATADEEWGRLVGATTQTYTIEPDAAVVVDLTFANVDEIEVKLNGGPVISLGPGNHPALRQRLLGLCDTLELKYQSEMLPSSAGTDAFAVEISRAGVPTVLVSIPSRNMHTPVEIVHPKDIERVGRLLAHLIAELDEAFIDELTPTLE